MAGVKVKMDEWLSNRSNKVKMVRRMRLVGRDPFLAYFGILVALGHLPCLRFWLSSNLLTSVHLCVVLLQL